MNGRRREPPDVIGRGRDPYRGWRQWPDDFGRLELERFNVAQFDGVADASAAGPGQDYLGLYAHPNLWPQDDPGLRRSAGRELGRPVTGPGAAPPAPYDASGTAVTRG